MGREVALLVEFTVRPNYYSLPCHIHHLVPIRVRGMSTYVLQIQS